MRIQKNLPFRTVLKGTCMVILVACQLASIDAWACSTTQWLPGASGNVASTGKPAVGGACGLEVTGTGYVQDNTPSKETQFVGRFYFFPRFSGSGTADIFVAYPNKPTAELFSVRYDGSGILVDASSAGGDVSTSIPVEANRWHLIEFSWQSNTTGSLWVNADATSDPASASFSSGTGTVESIRLGAPNGFGGLTGTAFFDDYVSRRTGAVGGILPGDANGDGVYDLTDTDAIIQEFLHDTHSVGMTDCNLDGEVNSGDINCVMAKIFQ